MPSSEKHSRKDKDKHDKDKWHVKTLDEIREEKKKKKENEEKKKSKDPGKEMEKAPRQRHISSGDEKMDDDEDDALNIQPPQAKPSTHKDSRHRKDEKRKHGRSHSSDKDRKRRKRSRSAEKGKSRSKDADRVRDRDRDRERERPRDRERDDYIREREKKSRKEHREDTRPVPSSVHHDESRQAGSSGQGHQSDLRQIISDRRDDTRQVTVVAERVQQKETERRPREGKKEGEREKERREDRHEDRHREREKREKDEKREKSRDTSKQEGSKDRSRSRKDEIIEERREGSRPNSKERSSGSNRSEDRGDSRSRRSDKEHQPSSSKDRSPHRSSREDKRKRDDRRKEGRESEQDSDQRRSKSKSSKSNERERWNEDDEEHQRREERKMEKEDEEEEEEYERRAEEGQEVENASSSEEEEEESDDEEEEEEEEESSDAESESEEEEEEVEGQEASSSEEEESAEEGEASAEELEEGEHKQSDEEEEEEEEEEEAEEEEEEEEESEEEESDSDSDSESEDESEKSGSEADQDETLKEEEKAKVKQEKEVDSAKIYVPKSKFDDDTPSPSGELRGRVEEEVEEEEEVMDQSDTEYLQDSPVASPVELEEKLPPYLPAIQGCRSVEEFQCLNRIAEGTYGVVYRANEKKKNDIVALKRLKMEKEKEGFPITSLREISTLLKAQHRNIVTVREIVVGSNMDKIYIVMDYVEHDLKSLMETMKQPFTIGETKCLMLQLLRGVHHLHDNWILHRDLKTSNLLLNHQGCLKIGDFGLAREYGSPIKPYTSIVVTLWYRAPELLLGTKVYSTPIDMWSVGCIFAEFLTIKPIFNGRSEIDQLNRIFKELGTPSEKIWPGYNELPAVKKTTFAHHPYNNLRSRFGTYLTDVGFELLNRFLTYDPVRRVSAEDALKHPYFTESPQPINEDMFPTWPAKSEMVRTNKPRSPQAPEGGQQFAKLEKEDGDSGFRMALPTQGSSASSAGFSLKF